MTESTHADDAVLTLLTQLDSAATRSVLRAASEAPRSVEELTEACGRPSSTVYRKVRRLEAAGLLDERVRVRPDGQPVSEYRLPVRGLRVTLDFGSASGLDWSTEELYWSSGGPSEAAMPSTARADGGPATATRQTKLREFG